MTAPQSQTPRKKPHWFIKALVIALIPAVVGLGFYFVRKKWIDDHKDNKPAQITNSNKVGSGSIQQNQNNGDVFQNIGSGQQITNKDSGHQTIYINK